MATQLGNATKSLGREFGIIMSNMAGNDLYTNGNLRPNSLIVSSPINELTLEDTGTYNLFATDGDGNPVRLSYTIKPGKGLITDPSGDVIEMSIDGGPYDEDTEDYEPKGSICVDEHGTIFVNKTNIIDEDTLTVNTSGDATVNTDGSQNAGKVRGVISVVTANLVRATDQLYGISKGDEFTTYIDPQIPGQISVNTQNLETVDDSSNRDGIVRHSSEAFRTIKTDDGKLEVITYNLDKADKNNLGVVKSDEETIHSDFGVLSVITSGLDHSTDSDFGISKGDNKTIKTNDGVLNVVTTNLDRATENTPGIVIPDSYSMEVDSNGIIYVKRYESIKSLLETNPKEHDIFAEDIEDLKNRVAKLETIHEAETIEMLIPVGETRTQLPKPELNEEDEIVDETISKTIPFMLKTNCKYNVKIEYEMNENPQIKATSIQVGDGEKYSDFGTRIFDETGNTTNTLNITFAISNFKKEKDEDGTLVDNVNTKVIVTVSSINDSAIKQSATHVFARWNTEAFTKDPEPDIEPNDPDIPTVSEIIIHQNSGKLSVYSNPETNFVARSEGIKEIAYNTTSTYNFYFTYTVDATYNYTGSDGKLHSENLTNIQQSAEAGDTPNPTITVIDEKTGQAATWCSCTLAASYNTTKAFNMLSVKSTKELDTVDSRTAIITLTLPGAVETVTQFNKIDTSKFKATKLDLDIKKIDEQFLTVKKNLKLVQEKADNSNITSIKKNIAQVKQPKAQVVNASLKPVLDTDELRTIKEEFDNAINIVKVEPTKLELETNELFDENLNLDLNISKKITVKEKTEAIEKLADVQKRVIKIFEKYNSFSDIAVIENNNSSVEGKTLVFKYTEKAKETTPRVAVTSEIKKGQNYVSFTMERTKDTLVNGDNWGLDIYYKFVDKNGTAINTDGSTTNPKEYVYALTATKNELKKTSSATSNDISTAQSGVYNTTTAEDRFYDVISINVEVTNKNFLFFSGDDTATIRFGSYSWDNSRGGVYSTIPDNIYLVLKCWNVSSNKWNAVYPLKGYASGRTFNITDALNFEVVGITSYSSGNYASFTMKSGTRKYKLGVGSNTPTDASSNSYKEKRGTEQVPVKVNNNITGILITKVSIKDQSFVFAGENYNGKSNPGNSITVTSNGSWVSAPATTNSTTYTFGDATITNITIETWDDYEMVIKFNLNPGSNTKIPLGATINNEFSNAYGKTNFIFIQNGMSYEYTQLYDYYEFKANPWTNAGTTITYRLYNKFNLNYDATYKTRTLLYNKHTGVLNYVYTEHGIDYGDSITDRDKTYDTRPLLGFLTGIKFWFTLTVQSISLNQKFCVSKSAMSDKIPLTGTAGCTFNGGISKSISIPNAFYTTTSTSSTSKPQVTYYNTYINK